MNERELVEQYIEKNGELDDYELETLLNLGYLFYRHDNSIDVYKYGKRIARALKTKEGKYKLIKLFN